MFELRKPVKLVIVFFVETLHAKSLQCMDYLYGECPVKMFLYAINLFGWLWTARLRWDEIAMFGVR